MLKILSPFYDFQIFTIFDQNMFLKIFWKGKIDKTQHGIELMTHSCIANALTHCAMLLDYKFWKEKEL